MGYKTPGRFRYDPLYRVIDDVGEFDSLEGKLHFLYERLKNIDSLGVIPRVYEMARYPKYEHTLGTLHQVCTLLQIAHTDTIPNKYRDPLRLAAMLLHVGHFPFTLTTERAAVLASNLGDRDETNKVREYLGSRIRAALGEVGVPPEDQKEIISDLFEFRNILRVYRYLSAEMASRHVDKITSSTDISPGEFKTVLGNIIDEDSDGNKYVTMANRSDYVQRDALYFGTVKIDLSPKHLYSSISRYNPGNGVSEKNLIDISHEYLKQKFYNSDSVVAFSRLLEKVLASLMLSTNFDLEVLESYGDRDFERLICDGIDRDGNRVDLPEMWCKRAQDILNGEYRYEKVFKIGENQDPLKIREDIIDLEYMMLGKGQSKRGLAKYPFEQGMLIDIRYTKDVFDVVQKDELNAYSVSVYRDVTAESLTPMVRTISNLSPFLSLSHVGEIRRGVGQLLSSTEAVRFDDNKYGVSNQVTKMVAKAIERIDANDENAISGLISEFRLNLKTYNSVWQSFLNSFWLLSKGTLFSGDQARVNLDQTSYVGLAIGILNLPVRLMQYAKPVEFLSQIDEELSDMVIEEEFKSWAGDVFEAKCVINKIMSRSKVDFQFLINGLIEVDPGSPSDNQDINEHDIIEILLDGSDLRLNLYACTKEANYEEKDRQSLSHLAYHIHDNVDKNAAIHTYHMIPRDVQNDDWTPEVENAGIRF